MIMTYETEKIQFYAFLILTLDLCVGFIYVFTLHSLYSWGRMPRSNWTEGLMDPRAGVDGVNKSL
jgi:hypothetical protein